ncbi:hypothetical protein HMPREF9601_01523 [Cutibacterium acnes HL030PA1]|uniref:Conserved protein n=1 Tax=Cutibacterium acnes (strain DSM 16379 / KPA171202) TaxID=267747 RepID=Q6AB87_CUTAK|nr:conserved protein [Cutibacterium acnes KPA171202]AEH28539.1 hypothetical protein TIB1ST10_01135 [Cutibacterium acnes 6609]EFT78237.1 hypothetical protein HMPREF9601_01523 [Cutibacterium acnes HL030PA1]
MQKTRCQTPLSPSEINNLIEALHQGVTPATGCTEPIALAYAAARAKRALGSDAKQLDSLHIDARVSPNIMKNGMAVMVPRHRTARPRDRRSGGSPRRQPRCGASGPGRRQRRRGREGASPSRFRSRRTHCGRCGR